jgi:alkaline phosphatase
MLYLNKGKVSMLKIIHRFQVVLFVFAFLVINVSLMADSPDENNALYKGKGAKYIFLFIGDGMGPLHLEVAERALKTEKQQKLWINTLPVKGRIDTPSYGGKITDSAAAATALACGVKTRNGVLGLDEKGNPVRSIAEKAKKMDWKVGIISCVQLNHATPAGFYAHRQKRSMYDEIIDDLGNSGFDYFGGGSFIIKGDQRKLYAYLNEKKYNMISSPKEFPELDPAKKYIVHSEMPYVLDRDKNSGFTLADFVRLGLKHVFVDEGKSNGFFIMVEGGRIDWASHANDTGAMVHEVKAFDETVKVALDFYKKHSDSTTIIVTADHETGNLTANFQQTKKNWNASRLLAQKHSYGVINNKLREYKKQNMSFDQMVSLIKEDYGIKSFSKPEMKKLREAWEVFNGNQKSNRKIKLLYGSYNPFAMCLQHIFSKRCGIEWKNFSHSVREVPVCAIGVGAEIFEGFYENNQIAKKVESLMNPQQGK